MNNDEIKLLYEQFLNSMCGWRIYKCDSCGRNYTHPGNYCIKCPGKLVQVRMTWSEYIYDYIKQHKLLILKFEEFCNQLKEKRIMFDYDEVYRICHARIYEMMKEINNVRS